MGRKKISRATKQKASPEERAKKKIKKSIKKSTVKNESTKQAGDHRIKDIKVERRTLQDLYNQGVYVLRPGGKVYNNDWVIMPFFKKLPKDLVVDATTPPGTLVWRAKDFLDGNRRKPFKILKHYPPTEFCKVGGVDLKEDNKDNDGFQSAAHYDAVCLIPSKQFRKHSKDKEKIEGYIEQKKEAKLRGEIGTTTVASEALKTPKKKVKSKSKSTKKVLSKKVLSKKAGKKK